MIAPMSCDVFIIDDDAEYADYLAILLRRQGYGVQVETSPRRATEKLTATKPALAILDLNLPGVDGLEICRKLRLDPGTAPISTMIIPSSRIETA